MLDWPTTSSYPTGYLRADGSAVSRVSYADLFALIGTTYGSGDGSTTFNLPNLVAAGSGSPVKIIKASLGGTVEPSTVAHAASHIRSGSDIIDADRAQIDFVPTRYTRDSSPTEAGANTDLTAHLKGIDNGIGLVKLISGSLSSTSVNITNCFSSTYNNYKLVLNNIVFSGSGADVYCRMLVASSPYSGAGYYWSYRGLFSNSTSADSSSASQTLAYLGISGSPNTCEHGTYEFFNPFLTTVTTVFGSGSGLTIGTGYSIRNGGFSVDTTTSYNGFQLLTNSAATFTGSYTLYGYN
jgi:hypothetical protein